MPLSGSAVAALSAAGRYLIGHQHADGRWEDFDLPVGPSDAWMTAYTGLAVAMSARVTGDRAARQAAARGAEWLAGHRPYDCGWGFNASTGPDADSTAFALRLLRAVEAPRQPQDEAWLAARWQPCGGCATYDADDGWGTAHPDVTAAAFFGLGDADRARLTPAVREYVRLGQDCDGSWPTYWWRARHYSTFHNLLLSRALDLAVARPSWDVTSDAGRMVHSAFDLAFVTGSVALVHSGEAANRLVEELMTLQDPSGCWPGAANLRVTRHDAPDPFRHPAGRLFTDINHLLTTASVVHVLSVMHGLEPS